MNLHKLSWVLHSCQQLDIHVADFTKVSSIWQFIQVCEINYLTQALDNSILQ